MVDGGSCPLTLNCTFFLLRIGARRGHPEKGPERGHGLLGRVRARAGIRAAQGVHDHHHAVRGHRPPPRSGRGRAGGAAVGGKGYCSASIMRDRNSRGGRSVSPVPSGRPNAGQVSAATRALWPASMCQSRRTPGRSGLVHGGRRTTRERRYCTLPVPKASELGRYVFEKIGAPERTRTSDLKLRRLALYPTELRARVTPI